jgi:hypothetical protein
MMNKSVKYGIPLELSCYKLPPSGRNTAAGTKLRYASGLLKEDGLAYEG